MELKINKERLKEKINEDGDLDCEAGIPINGENIGGMVNFLRKLSEKQEAEASK